LPCRAHGFLEILLVTGSPAWITSLTSRLIIHFDKIPLGSLQDPSSIQVSQIRFVTVLKSSGIYRDRESAPPVVLVRLQGSGIGDVKLICPSSLPAPVKPCSPVKRKRKRGLAAGVIPGSDEDEDDEEVYSWESGPEDDGLGVSVGYPMGKDEGGSQR
jgi:hypothetical protein